MSKRKYSKYRFIPSKKKPGIQYYKGNNEGWPSGAGWYPKEPIRDRRLEKDVEFADTSRVG